MAGKHPSMIPDEDSALTDTTAAFGLTRVLHDLKLDEVKETVNLMVDYGAFKLENGMKLTPDQLANEPRVDLSSKTHGANAGTYTLMLVDVDSPAPTKPHYRSWLHWLVVNIPVADVRRGEVAVPYSPPDTPQPGSQGGHRMALLSFKQGGHLDPKKNAPAASPGFQVHQWCVDHGLEGNPSAGLSFYLVAGK